MKKKTAKKATAKKQSSPEKAAKPASSPLLTPAQFKKLKRFNATYGTDSKFVYAGHRKIEQADPQSFQVLNDQYAQDETHIYCGFDTVPSALHYRGVTPPAQVDRASFQILGKDFAKDKHHVYWHHDIAYGLDPAKIIYLSEHFLKDTSKVYHFYAGHNAAQLSTDKQQYLGMKPMILPNADAKEFRVLGSYYGADGKNVYWKDYEIPQADAARIQYLKDDFAKDSNRVYFQGEIVGSADPKTFQILGDTCYCKDKERVWAYAHEAGEYCACIEMEGEDPDDFDPATAENPFGSEEYED